MTVTTHNMRRGIPAPSTPGIAPCRTLTARDSDLGATTNPGRPSPAGTGAAARTLLDDYPGETLPPALVPAAAALSEDYAARTWGNEATRLRFHVTVPAGRYEALDLRDELIGWLRRRGLDLGLTDDGTDVYMTWPAPRILPEWGPLPDDCTSVFPPRTPSGPPVYGKPTVIALACAGHETADCGDVTIGFALTDNDDAGTCGIYRGTISQSDLFTVLHDAGLITRREGE